MVWVVTVGVFLLTFLLCAALGLLSAPAAWLGRRWFPAAVDVCTRCLAGWTTRRGLAVRLVVTPLVVTIAVLTGFAWQAARDTRRFRDAILAADQLVVRSGGLCHRDIPSERVLFATDDRQELERLARNISIGVSLPMLSCACCGDITFELRRGGDLYLVFSLHHGWRIRADRGASGDLDLTSRSRARLAAWLEQTGIQRNLEHALKEQEERRGNRPRAPSTDEGTPQR